MVGSVTVDQLPDPTLCTGYDAAQLRGHVLGWLASTDGYQVPADPAAEVRAAASTITQAVSRPAAPAFRARDRLR